LIDLEGLFIGTSVLSVGCFSQYRLKFTDRLWRTSTKWHSFYRATLCYRDRPICRRRVSLFLSVCVPVTRQRYPQNLNWVTERERSMRQVQQV